MSASAAEAACISNRLIPDGTTASIYGAAVAAGPDFVAVGVPGDNLNGTNAGAVYLYTDQNGVMVPGGVLRAEDSGPNSFYGGALATSGDTILVGAPWDDGLGAFAGAAYVLRRGGQSWSQEAKLLAPDGMEQDFFGGVVALDGDVAAITTIGQDAGADGASAVYLFQRSDTTWGFSAKLTDPEPTVGGRFGHSLAVADDRVAVGSNVTDRVRVYVRDAAGWQLEQTLTAVNPPPGETGFGTGLAMHGNYLAASAIHLNSHEGVVFLFSRNGGGWTFLERKDSPDHIALGHFGWKLAMSETYLAVGADFTRRLFLYQRIGDLWRYDKMVQSDSPAIDDGFGSVVSISQFFVVAGAPDDPEDAGVAYAYPTASCITSIPATSSVGITVLTLGLMSLGGWIARRRASSGPFDLPLDPEGNCQENPPLYT